MCSTFQGYPGEELMCGMIQHNVLLCPLVSFFFHIHILKFGSETHPRTDLSLLRLVRRP